jgi:hypothetical protein
MKRIYFFSITITLIVFSSCQKKPDIGGTAAEKMANEWWVTLDQGNNKDVFSIGHFKIATYNSASNDNTIWVDDLENGWGFKSKATADFNSLTFAAASGVDNFYYDPAHPTRFPKTVKITEGKIIPNAGHSKTGVLTDSIYMKVEFSDDPGTIYTMPGHARTRFAEDDY